MIIEIIAEFHLCNGCSLSGGNGDAYHGFLLCGQMPGKADHYTAWH